MKKRIKSKPEDNGLAYDEGARPVDRASAISRLTADGFEEIEPLLAQLIISDDFLLRGEAIKALLGLWKKSHYLNDAVRMLHTDAEWSVRGDAAFSLTQFALRTGVQQETIVRELVRSLTQDEHFGVQEACYRGLLKLLTQERKLSTLPTSFNRERDVDWELLKPYLDEAQIPQSRLTR